MLNVLEKVSKKNNISNYSDEITLKHRLLGLFKLSINSAQSSTFRTEQFPIKCKIISLRKSHKLNKLNL